MVSVRIPLSQGRFARVSIEDAECIMAHTWYAQESRYTYYASRNLGRGHGKIYMHSAIAGPGCDHINRNGLDNRRSNLRKATPSEQNINTKIRTDNTSGHKGVHYDTRSGKWRATICKHGKYIGLGLHAKREDAIAVRRRAEVTLYGDFSPYTREDLK